MSTEPNIMRILLERDRYGYQKIKRNHTLQQLFWECTLKCNLRCQHCGSDCKTNAIDDDMPLSDFLPVLDDLATHMDPRHVLVVTTGGEPLVRPDIVECGREITRRGYIWGMVSNAMLLTGGKLDQLMDAGLKTIAISLDGFEDDHNWMRGHHLSFERAVTAVKALVHRRITWDVITCVNQRNIGCLEEFKEFLISIGVRQWRIFTVFPAGRAKNNGDLQLSPQQLRYVMDFIVSTRKEGRIALSYSCEGFLGHYEYEVRDHSFFCQAGINVASILSDGSISGCLSIRSNYNQGNIYHDNFWDVWNSRFAQYRNRQWAKTEACADCEMWRYCEGNGMHLRDENGKLIICNYKKNARIMKRISKKISNWGLAGTGVFLAMLCTGVYKMFNVVYGPPVEPCLYGPPPFEIIDSLKNDTVNNYEQVSKDSVNIKSSTFVRIPVDTRSPNPVISVQSVGDLQYCRQS